MLGFQSLAGNAAMAVRLARDLPPFLRHTLSSEAAREQVRHELVTRDRRFLDMVDRAVFRRPASPYLRLLRHAGCEFGDIRALVRDEGVEGALRLLAARGVYVSFDEFKGRQPIVRGSLRFTGVDADFDGVQEGWHYYEMTGGSRGRPVRVGRTLPYVQEIAATVSAALGANGLRDAHHLLWAGASPTWSLIYLKLGYQLDAWLHLVEPLPREARVGIAYMRLLARLSLLAGRGIPAPAFCDLQAPERVVRRLANYQARGRTVVLNTTTSSAVRVAAAAQAMGRSLEGVVLHCRSEPLTAARRRQIEVTGARTFADYASVELSTIAYSCPNGDRADDLHLLPNRHAVVERTRPIFEGGPLVDALLVTTLSLNAPKVALNLETGDTARISERACGCQLEAAGLHTHLSEIRSFEKLSTEGTSFARESILRILEEVLPARFGGTAIDYQVVEEETAEGATRMLLRIHPAVGDLDETAVGRVLLAELAGGGMVGAYQARLLQRAESLVVQRLPPLATGAGKVLPFHLLRLTAPTR